MERPSPEADVIWWDSSSYYVRCPFCEGVHRHTVNWQTSLFRVSDCEKGETYQSCFPINDQGEVAYEIDKKRERYVNICVSNDSDTEADDNEDEDDVDRLATEMAHKATIAAEREERHLSITRDAKETIIHTIDGEKSFEYRLIYDAITDCFNGKTRAVQGYLKTSSEAELFVRGQHPDGKTMLISAASEKTPEMLSLLIEHGADVNAVDNHGRSALMEAALFGRVGNVKVLLEHGADPNIRDDENRRAVYFARESRKNRKERNVRTQDTYEMLVGRQEIVRLLSGEIPKSKNAFGKPPTPSLSRPYRFLSSNGGYTKVLHGPIEEYPMTKCGKTVARLERGGKFPSVGAMSGWSHTPAQPLRVDARQWTDDVFYIAEIVGHHLASHACDQGICGQYNACHAEKQLIAYFIDRHVFLPRDGLPDPKLEEEITRVEDELERITSCTEIGRVVASLRKEKQELDDELFDGDEKLVGKDDEIKKLESKRRDVKTALNQLIASPRARRLRMLECKLEILGVQRQRHEDLTEMAEAPPPPASLSEAAILVSSVPCDDCKAFTERVNKHFGLCIQLFASV
ncbi:hypothetical protein CBS63078_2089 [Aspergillus niger]|uniref:Contig An04c0140, genomic contig n=2 Tax=Aspergillus niger TaxID=5061 RepID=A2QIR0_ASPNC|nr:uncharacterized protein An04g04400 [Aspergillus niger]KAI2822980.1 hypothetical protein CBS115989_1690 [Aspergillus niger]KAI2825335.1 hypothetical protein CBS133816_8579 [Aspergillus niger]KAI2858942.1 hypothetical protein CBS11232_2314 [Aspergillus niger]KAI2873257.1 hypothetical protein CBS115988_7123 [Aspergillus niger]KAI2888317.1 hypothetical protein CBS13152_6403 [Aspergillus niger]|eukprot:XP_001401806.1 ankyrin repeat domain [Aspergillus niger CBS 513.88]